MTVASLKEGFTVLVVVAGLPCPMEWARKVRKVFLRRYGAACGADIVKEGWQIFLVCSKLFCACPHYCSLLGLEIAWIFNGQGLEARAK